jgi:hypothetical protein
MSGSVAAGAVLIILAAGHHHADAVVNVTPTVISTVSRVSPSPSDILSAGCWFTMLVMFAICMVLVLYHDGD